MSGPQHGKVGSVGRTTSKIIDLRERRRCLNFTKLELSAKRSEKATNEIATTPGRCRFAGARATPITPQNLFELL